MGKQAIVLILIPLVAAMPIVHSTFSEEPKEVDEWLHKVRHAKEKVTKLHFYFHDTRGGGKNATSMKVAQASITDKSPNLFGLLVMMDDPLTEGPKLTSKLVGRAQGLWGSAARDEFGLLMTLSLVFIGGEYNGSTLSILGRNPTTHPIREMPIVGGSGVFRLARGLATAKAYSFNSTTNEAIVEYNVWVVHY